MSYLYVVTLELFHVAIAKVAPNQGSCVFARRLRGELESSRVVEGQVLTEADDFEAPSQYLRQFAWRLNGTSVITGANCGGKGSNFSRWLSGRDRPTAASFRSGRQAELDGTKVAKEGPLCTRRPKAAAINMVRGFFGGQYLGPP